MIMRPKLFYYYYIKAIHSIFRLRDYAKMTKGQSDSGILGDCTEIEK